MSFCNAFLLNGAANESIDACIICLRELVGDDGFHHPPSEAVAVLQKWQRRSNLFPMVFCHFPLL